MLVQHRDTCCGNYLYNGLNPGRNTERRIRPGDKSDRNLSEIAAYAKRIKDSGAQKSGKCNADFLPIWLLRLRGRIPRFVACAAKQT